MGMGMTNPYHFIKTVHLNTFQSSIDLVCMTLTLSMVVFGLSFAMANESRTIGLNKID